MYRDGIDRSIVLRSEATAFPLADMMLRMAGGHPEKAASAMLALCCLSALMTLSAGFTMPSSVQGLRRIHPSLHPSLRERKCGGVATPKGVVSGLRMADNPVNRMVSTT